MDGGQPRFPAHNLYYLDSGCCARWDLFDGTVIAGCLRAAPWEKHEEEKKGLYVKYAQDVDWKFPDDVPACPTRVFRGQVKHSVKYTLSNKTNELLQNGKARP